MSESHIDKLLGVLGRFDRAEAVVRTAMRSLNSRDPDCDEVVTLRVALRMLIKTHQALDAAMLAEFASCEAARVRPPNDPVQSAGDAKL